MKQFIEQLKRAAQGWQADKAPRLGASLAYYALFSLAPLLVVLVGTLGLFLRSSAAQAEVSIQAADLFGPSANQLVQQLIHGFSNQGGNILAIAIGGVVTLLGAVGIINQLGDVLDTINHTERVGSLKRTLKKYGSSSLLLLEIAVLLLLSLGASTLLNIVNRHLSGSFYIWHSIDVLVSIFISTLLFTLILRQAGSSRPAWHLTWPAGLFTAILFAIGKTLLSLYLSHSSLASAYGAAGSLAVVLVWLYYSFQIFLLGAEFLKVRLERTALPTSVGQVGKAILSLGMLAVTELLKRRKKS